MSRTYDLLLSDWISIGLHKDTLHKALQLIRNDRPLETLLSKIHRGNRSYIEKVLREEAIKQFSDRYRPLLEVVLNAIDAKPKEYQEEYKVKIDLGLFTPFTVKDNGRGMGLEDILRLLIIPFSTDKSGVEEIGMFGVGFLSTFGYCTEEPLKCRVNLDTQTKDEHYQLSFYAASQDISSLRLSLQKKIALGTSQTKVVIRKKMMGWERDNVSNYVGNNIKNVPEYKAKIYFGRKQINHTKGEKWYSQPLELEFSGKKYTQEVGIRMTRAIEGITLTSQGIKVKRSYNNHSGCVVSFPPLVRLVEGRDDFRLDQNYRSSAEAIFPALTKYIQDQKRKLKNKGQEQYLPYLVRDMSSFIPELLAALQCHGLAVITNLEQIKTELLSGKKYVLIEDQMAPLIEFFGPKVAAEAFETSHQGGFFWRESYKQYDDLIKDNFQTKLSVAREEIEKNQLNTIVNQKVNLPNFNLVGQFITPKLNFVRFGEAASSGKSCFLYGHYGGQLYVNTAHPLVAGPFDPTKAYSLLAEYYSNPSIQRVLEIDAEEAEDRTLRFLSSLTARYQNIVQTEGVKK